MSVRIMTAVWSVHLPDSDKLVLLALADCANDEGIAWPSMTTLASKCSKSDRTVQAAIKSLAASGHLTRRETPGKGCRYIIHPTTEAASPPKPLRPAKSSPPKRTTPTPEAASDKPSRTITPKHEGADADDATPEQKITGQRGRRIDLDWQPTKPLPERIAKVTAGWPPGRLPDVLDEFRAYWLAEAGKIASKLDWDLTWHNRLRAVIAHDQRQAEREERRNGNRAHTNRSSGWAARPGVEGAEPAYLAD